MEREGLKLRKLNNLDIPLVETWLNAMDILLKALQEGEAEFMEGDPFPGFKVIAIKDENRDPE